MKAARTVALVGPPSVGKSTLVRWFASRCVREVPRVVPVSWTAWAVWWPGVNILTFDDFVVREVQKAGLLAKCLASKEDVKDPVVIVETCGDDPALCVDAWVSLDCEARMLKARQKSYAKSLTVEECHRKTVQAREYVRGRPVKRLTNSTPAETEIAIQSLGAVLQRPVPIGPPLVRRRSMVQADLYRGFLRWLLNFRHPFHGNGWKQKRFKITDVMPPRYNPGVMQQRSVA